jgi:hypothetical protein
METASVHNIYNAILLLSDNDRNQLYAKMQKEFYSGSETVAYTASGKALTQSEYCEQIRIGLAQIEQGEWSSDEEFEKEITVW